MPRDFNKATAFMRFCCKCREYRPVRGGKVKGTHFTKLFYCQSCWLVMQQSKVDQRGEVQAVH